MGPLVDKLARALLGGNVPLPLVVRKVAMNARALAYGQIFLRDCDRVGARPRCFGRPRILNHGAIIVGDDFAAGCAFGAASIESARGAAVVLGDSVTINYGTSIHAEREVRVGSRVMIGPYCLIVDSDIAGSYDDAAPIEIGDDVWLAARVVVRPGARIGAGAVISAGSVVEGEIPAGAVASGSPARVLRIRHASPPL